jgi:hypothetical protein
LSADAVSGDHRQEYARPTVVVKEFQGANLLSCEFRCIPQ